MRLGLLTIVGTIAALSEVASAQNKPVYKSLDTVNFLGEAKDLMGTRITVTDCTLLGASISLGISYASISCNAPYNGAGFAIDFDTLDGVSIRRA